MPPPAGTPVPVLGPRPFKTAYCTVRGWLPLAALQTLLTRSTTKMAECVREWGLGLGHRLSVLDGSSFSMPDTDDLCNHFGNQAATCLAAGFPRPTGGRWFTLAAACFRSCSRLAKP